MIEKSEQIKQEDQEVNLRQLFEQYAYFWKWFLLSTILCGLAAVLYLRYTTKIYNVQTKILLQDDKQPSGDLAGLAELASLTGGGGTPAFVADQIDVIKSRRILTKVVQNNKLNIIYKFQGNVSKSEVLVDDSPVKLVILDSKNQKLDSTSYQIVLKFVDN